MGTKNQGQGHETMFKQILNEKLGIDPDEVQYIDGDTDRVAFGMGTNGSRSTVLGGSALFVAADKVIEKGKMLAGHMLEAGEQDIEFADGNFTVKGTDKTVTLKEVAKAAFNPTKWPKGFEGGLYENATFKAEKDTYPNGCHICELEVDPETGDVTVDRYFVVDDVGTVMNPTGLKGQIHGGVAQGIGQILCEQVVWDRESGPAPDRELPRLRHAARPDDPEHGSEEQSGADQVQPARRQGRGRGGHRRRHAGGDERHHGRAGAARRQGRDDAGDAAQRVARDRGGEEMSRCSSPRSRGRCRHARRSERRPVQDPSGSRVTGCRESSWRLPWPHELLRRPLAPLRLEAFLGADRLPPLAALRRSVSAQRSCTRPHGSAQ